MVDDLHCNLTGSGLLEVPGFVAVERCPGVFIDLRLQGGLERLVRVVRA